jgi:hypothetical protein
MSGKTVNRKIGLQNALREAAKGLDVPALPSLRGNARALPSADGALIAPDMDVSDLRVAIFSGNYNYVRDGANQALRPRRPRPSRRRATLSRCRRSRFPDAPNTASAR